MDGKDGAMDGLDDCHERGDEVVWNPRVQIS